MFICLPFHNYDKERVKTLISAKKLKHSGYLPDAKFVLIISIIPEHIMAETQSFKM